MMKGSPSATDVALKRKQELDSYLSSRNIAFGQTKMEPKKAAGGGQAAGDVELTTNVHLLDLTKKVQIFRYEVKIEGVVQKRSGEELKIDLTEKASSDYLNVDRRYKCRDVMQLYEAKNEAMLKQNNNLLYYDLSRILFTLNDMGIPKNGAKSRYAKEELPPQNGANGMKHFPFYDITILPLTDSKALSTIGDLSFLTDDAGKMDHSLEQFLDIATAQNVFKNPDQFMHYSSALSFLLNPSNYGFTPADCPYFPSNGSYLGIGAEKGVRMIEHQTQSAAMVISTAKSPFHAVESLMSKVQAMLPQTDLRTLHNGTKNRISKVLKGLYVTTTYPAEVPEQRQTFAISGISNTNAANEQITFKDGQVLTVQHYYQKHYSINLEHPYLPLVIRKDRDRDSFYPMELLVVCDNQRIKSQQQTPAQVQEMIKKCAVAPTVVLTQNENIKQSLALNHSEHLNRAAVRFHDEPIKVRARVLQPPNVQFASGTETPKPSVCNWMGRSQYFIPATCQKWFAFAFTEVHGRDTLRQDAWNDFVKRFYQTLLSKGMHFPPAEKVELFNMGQETIADIIARIANAGCEYVLIAHPDAADDVHHQMKYNERMTEVVTQGLKLSTVKKVLQSGQPLTMANIVNKTNVKMGGLNYMLPLFAERDLYAIFKETLFIGFSMNHPAGGMGSELAEPPTTGNANGAHGQGQQHLGGNGGNGHNGNGKPGGHTPPRKGRQSPPSIVGYSANIGMKNHFEFMGGYKFQEARRDENINIVAQVVIQCVEQYRQREQKFPSRIMIYRNACGEGFYQHLLKYEIPLIKHALAERGCSTKITLLVVNKLQGIAFIPSRANPRDKPSEQNIKPGTVVDTTVVHPKWNEFFLGSHRALQGTARVPRYALLLDESHFQMDQLEQLTYNLCYGHQIVFSPTSLPTPVYVAEEYAKRGRNNYNTSGLGSSTENWDDVTDKLGFENTTYLGKLRVNA